MRRTLCLVLVLALSCGGLFAVTPNSAVTPQTPTLGIAQLTNANSAANAYIVLYTAGAAGVMCVGGSASNTDSASAYSLQVAVQRSATNYLETTVSIPLSSGNTAAAPPVAFMSAAAWPGLPLNSDGNPYILLAIGDKLSVASTTQVASGKFVTVTVVCSDF